MLNKSSLRYLLATNKKSSKKFSSVKNFSSLLMTTNDNNSSPDLASPSTSKGNSCNSMAGRSVSAPTSPYKTIIKRQFHETNYQVKKPKTAIKRHRKGDKITIKRSHSIIAVNMVNNSASLTDCLPPFPALPSLGPNYRRSMQKVFFDVDTIELER
uniref:CSON001692 protein n=1 Tax=Culicoides sonorensis TaxID=179676 RepID=A0A336KGA3_CULSO